jgi:hypothetical protein
MIELPSQVFFGLFIQFAFLLTAQTLTTPCHIIENIFGIIRIYTRYGREVLSKQTKSDKKN